MKQVLIASVLMLASSAGCADVWTKSDSEREMTFLALQFIDYGQTRTIAKHPENYYEMNEILGAHPSVGKVNTYFAVTTLLQMAIARALPYEYRSTFQYITIGVEVGAVANNMMVGIHHDFF